MNPDRYMGLYHSLQGASLLAGDEEMTLICKYEDGQVFWVRIIGMNCQSLGMTASFAELGPCVMHLYKDVYGEWFATAMTEDDHQDIIRRETEAHMKRRRTIHGR